MTRICLVPGLTNFLEVALLSATFADGIEGRTLRPMMTSVATEEAVVGIRVRRGGAKFVLTGIEGSRL